MNRLVLLLSLLISSLCPAVISAETYPIGSRASVNDILRDKKKIVERERSKANAEWKNVKVSTQQAGQLRELLGEDIYTLDGIEVSGPINDDDFNTLWDSSYNGKLKSIDLGQAVVENGIVPEQALFHTKDQIDWDTGTIYTVWLERIILPEGVTEIGRLAFGYATTLTEIHFPKSLKRIGESAFTDCIRLATDPLVFPENLEELGWQAFMYCKSLKGEVVLPQTMRYMEGATFYLCNITKINFPESLEYIGLMSFSGCDLREVDLPDNCTLAYEVGAQFSTNHNLTRVHLPENLTYLPENLFDNDLALKEVNIPTSTEVIGDGAFWDCSGVKDFIFPEGLRVIGQCAFIYCTSLSKIILPSTVTCLKAGSFGSCGHLKKLYCKATIPPVCIMESTIDNEIDSPFYKLPTDVQVYVPVGTAELYRNAEGWNYFTDFIETENFPSSTDEIEIENPEIDNTIYDLSGLKVSEPEKGRVYIRNGKKTISTR